MANQKISELVAVTDLLTTDEYVLARAGTSKKITGASLKANINPGFVAFKYDPRYTWLGTTLNRMMGAGTQSFGLGILTDSTSNATTDWFAQLGSLLAAKFPAYAVNYCQWSDTTQDYLAPQVIQASPGAARSVRFVTASSNSNFLPGASAQATPSADIDISVKCSLDAWVPAASQTLVAHFGLAGNRSFRFQVLSTGRLSLETCADGTTLIGHQSTVAPTVANGATLWVRATLTGDNGAAGHDVKFFTSADGVTWAQLGATVTTAGVTTLFNSTYQWEIGARNNNVEVLTGNIFEVQPRNGTAGVATTATGVNALNSATVNAAAAGSFPTVGSFILGLATPVVVTYTGKTATSFTGCSAHGATVGGETITPVRGPVILPCMPEHWQGPPVPGGGYATQAATVGSPVLNIVDAGAAGFGLTYLSDATRIKKMLPDYALKAVFLSTGHNDSDAIGVGGGRDKTYIANYQTWITNVKAWAYDAVPVICTQNPRLAPAGNITDHAIRREMLFALANQLAIPLLDGYQAFIDTGNVAAFTQADGIHPTATGAGDGMHLWATYAYNALFALA